MHPPRMSTPSCIMPPTEQLVIRPHIVPLLPTFHGMESENPYSHIKEFEDVCNTFQEGGATIDLMRLKLFPFTLKDKAKVWLNSLRLRSIGTWTDLQAEFLKKFFPTHRTNGLKRDVGMMKSQPNAKDGMYVLSEDMDMKAKFATMTRRLEELELKKVQEVQAISETPVQAMPCSICQSYEHLVEKCPTIPAVREMFGDHANVVGQFKPNNNAPYGSTYNSNRRNHPNFSWKPRPPQYTPLAQAPQQASNLEQAIVNLSKVRKFKAVITLRSGKEVVQPTPKLKHNEGSESEKDMGEKKSKEDDHDSRLVHVKRGLNVTKKAFLTEQVSAIIQCKSLVKYKDPGCPTISVNIGGTCVEKALLDLGASVNLLPYSVYKKLGLGD
ncbi:hypothetical protein CK203_060574 [Vitis vinifera]|uniref:Retrotransposon gag domain-containing protein n=1 Tax=Vitis vinifera TaxID=29760 RepID=A0A438FTS8_VITVI|nr:hypothetical protein CK203_060574 [Vitis vinifera]